MRVLTVLPDLPLPADTGLHLRMLGNLDVVGSLGAESHVLCFSTEERSENLRLLPEVAELCDSVTYAGPRKPQASFRKSELILLKINYGVGGALRRRTRSYPFSMRYDAVGGQQRTVDEVNRIAAEVVVLPSFLLHWAPAIRRTGALVIADSIDILTDLTARLAASSSWSNPVHRLSLASNYLASRSQETLFFPHCAEVWVTSPGEADRVATLSRGTRTVIIPNTVPNPELPSESVPQSGAIGFIGTYTSEPNLLAANRLARRVLPLVRARHPKASLLLAGSGMTPQDSASMRAHPGVEVLGRVQDSTDFIRSCSILALPIEVRGGVPLKLVEALALGRPVVASPEMVAGLPLRHGSDVLVADSDEGLASAIIQLIEDQDLRLRVGQNGRLAYEENFSRTALIRNAKRESILAKGCGRSES